MRLPVVVAHYLRRLTPAGVRIRRNLRLAVATPHPRQPSVPASTHTPRNGGAAPSGAGGWHPSLSSTATKLAVSPPRRSSPSLRGGDHLVVSESDPLHRVARLDGGVTDDGTVVIGGQP
jgi:hypothetical protein